jgi:hypothetical protein
MVIIVQTMKGENNKIPKRYLNSFQQWKIKIFFIKNPYEFI